MLFEQSGRRAYNRFVYVDGQKIHVAEMPAQGTRISSVPLLIFNALGANVELLEPFIDALHGVDVIAVDLPGCGSSPAPNLPYRFGGLADLMDGMLQEMGIDQVDVIGISWGGALAQEFAHAFPDRCRRLILASTSPGMVMVPGEFTALFEMATPRRYQSPDHMKATAGATYGGRMKTDPALVSRHAARMRSHGWRGYYYQLLCLTGWTSLGWLHRLEQPTLILSGREDPVVPPVNAKILHMRLRKSIIKYLDDGHMFVISMPEDAAKLVEDFVGDKDLLAARAS